MFVNCFSHASLWVVLSQLRYGYFKRNVINDTKTIKNLKVLCLCLCVVAWHRHRDSYNCMMVGW